MNINFVNIIKQIVAQHGEAILSNPARLKVFVRKYAKHEPKEIRLAFGRCIEQGYYRVLKQTIVPEERQEMKPKIAQQMHSISKLELSLCAEAVDILEAVLYGTPSRPPMQTQQKASSKLSPATPKKSIPRNRVIAFSAAAIAVLGIILFALFYTGVAAFVPVLEFNGEEYPSKIIATAATDSVLGGGPRMIENDTYIGDALGDLGVTLRLSLPEKIVRIEIEGDRLVKKSSLETQITTKKTVEIFPLINYNWTELEKLEEPYIETVSFRLYVDDKLKKEVINKVPFHSIHDEPLWDASRNGNKTLSNYHFVVVIHEMERIEQEQEKIRIEMERSESARLAAEQRLAAERREAARREAERASRVGKDPYNDPRIRATIAKVHANLRDVNGDGRTNCVDYSNLFYYYSPFKFTTVVVNLNPNGPQGGFNHQFNAVEIDRQLVFIEPQARASQPYDLKAVWGSKYNSVYNQIQKTNWLYLPRGQVGTEE